MVSVTPSSSNLDAGQSLSGISSNICCAFAQELLAGYGSPLYVYDGDRLRQTLGQISQAISYPQTRFCFATVTNGNLSLLRIVRDRQWGLHANSPGDIYLGLRAGFSPSEIVYSGSNLNRADMA